MARKKKNKSDASKTSRSSNDKSSKKAKDAKEFICEFCSKVYKSRSGLSKHKKKCPMKDVEPEDPVELPIEEELETVSKEFGTQEGEDREEAEASLGKDLQNRKAIRDGTEMPGASQLEQVLPGEEEGPKKWRRRIAGGEEEEQTE